MKRKQSSIQESLERIENLQRRSFPAGKRLVEQIVEEKRWRAGFIQAIRDVQRRGDGFTSPYVGASDHSPWGQVQAK